VYVYQYMFNSEIQERRVYFKSKVEENVVDAFLFSHDLHVRIQRAVWINPNTQAQFLLHPLPATHTHTQRLKKGDPTFSAVSSTS